MKLLISLAALVAISSAAKPLSELTPCPVSTSHLLTQILDTDQEQRDCIVNAIKKETTCSAEDAKCLCEIHTRTALQVDATQCVNSKCTNQEGQGKGPSFII